MTSSSTQMLAEIREAPAVVARQIAEAGIYREEGERLRREEPRFLATCARGSSDQAVTYFKYMAEQRLGIPVASVGPSVASGATRPAGSSVPHKGTSSTAARPYPHCANDAQDTRT